jgi:hypothetical protein
MSKMQSAKLAITNRVIAIKDSSPSHSKLLVMAGLAAAVLHISNPKVAEYCHGLLGVIGKASFDMTRLL